jgi:hypothetical protein
VKALVGQQATLRVEVGMARNETISSGTDRMASPLFEITIVLVCFDHVARVIENANHGIM